MLKEAYRKLRHSIVAFGTRYTPRPEGEAEPALPNIDGTGFVVDADGVIATNRHVIDAIREMPKPDGRQENYPARALLFVRTNVGIIDIRLPILDVFQVEDVVRPSGGPIYDPSVPDIGFIRVDASGLLPVSLDAESPIEEGEEIATAGYPMGELMLLDGTRVNQVAPTLQAGIVSAIQPFPSKAPHSFSINVMTQGGASGSPVFRCADGAVIGLVRSRVVDPQTIEGHEIPVPTNFTIALPSHMILKALDATRLTARYRAARPTRSIHEIVANRKVVGAMTGGVITGVKLPW